MTNIILGTAGHIDHGKTALIKALTGVDLDRLKEEKERGITIELGFASLSLSGNQKVGVVDVPGHEKFIKRMIAGAGGIDLVMLVVAADDGVMPQTKEHLDICELLGIKYGLIVVTKIDLVEPEWLELIKDDSMKLVKGTFLEGAPIVPVSAITNEGIPQLISTLETIVPKIKKDYADGLSFLPIDRVFTMKGFGTVVTGTLISGEIKMGEALEVLPHGFQAKVRGIQVYNNQVKSSFAGQRTAINLQGVEKSSLQRGDTLSQPGALKPSLRFDVRLRLLSDAPQPLKHGEEIRFHLFTSQASARVISYEGNILEPGGDYYVQLRFLEPMVSIPGARFVIRGLDATRTIGGGEILDPHPPRHHRNDPNTLVWFRNLKDKNLEAILTSIALTNGVRGLSPKEVFRRISAPNVQIKKTWNELLKTRTLIEINPESPQFLHQETLLKYEQKLKDLIESYHKKNPLKPGIHLEEARQRLGLEVSEDFYKFLIQEMKSKGAIEVTGVTIHQANHKVSLSTDQGKLKSEIEATLRSQGLAPYTVRELSEQFSVSPEEIKNLLDLSVQDGVLLKIKDDFYFFRQHIWEIKRRLVEYFGKNKEMTPGDFKEMTGLTRKYLIPLLEYFDREKVTIRAGDKRILRDRKPLG